MKSLTKIIILAAILAGLAAPSYAESIVIEGSTTVLPIAQRAAEEFMNKDSAADISVRGGGSGVGIASLIAKTCDIADASRAMKDQELEQAVARGVDPVANVVAMDGIAMVVNSSNPIDALTKQQVKDIFTGKISYWSELGGANEPIVVVSRDSASGTFESFGELALDKQKVRKDALMEASNGAVASTIARTPNAIGYVGLGFISTSGLKPLALNGVMPSKKTVLSKKYALSRPLFMYTNGKPQGLVKDFLDFVLSKEGQALVGEEGYVELN
jgi:phosphate transport system substrate-binding protein